MEAQKKELKKLLAKLNIELDTIDSASMLYLISTSLHNKIKEEDINEQLNSLMEFNPNKSIYNNQLRKPEIIDYGFKLATTEKEVNSFQIKSVTSEPYHNQKIYLDTKHFCIKPEVLNMFNYKLYNIVAKVKTQATKINMSGIVTLIRGMSQLKTKYLGEYFLANSGIYKCSENSPYEFIEENISRLKSLFNPTFIPGTYNVSLEQLLSIRYFEEDHIRSGQPIWQVYTNDSIEVYSIGNFSISNNGHLGNIFIENSFRSIKNSEPSILDTMFDFIKKEAPKFGHEYIFTSSKNMKMVHLFKKHGFTIIGTEYPYLNNPGYSIPNEVVAVYSFNEEKKDKLIDTYLNFTDKPLFVNNPKINRLYQPDERHFLIEELNQREINKLIESEEDLNNIEYIGKTKGPLAIRLFNAYTMESEVFETLIFRIDNVVYTYPIIDIKTDYYHVNDVKKIQSLELIRIPKIKLIENILTYTQPNELKIFLSEEAHTPEQVPEDKLYIELYDIKDTVYSLEFMEKIKLLYGHDVLLKEIVYANGFDRFKFNEDTIKNVNFYNGSIGVNISLDKILDTLHKNYKNKLDLFKL